MATSENESSTVRVSFKASGRVASGATAELAARDGSSVDSGSVAVGRDALVRDVKAAIAASWPHFPVRRQRLFIAGRPMDDVHCVAEFASALQTATVDLFLTRDEEDAEREAERVAHAKTIAESSQRGDFYRGEFQNGSRHGYGECKYADGSGTYKGSWRHGKRHGRGTMEYANGDVYIGEWVDDERCGRGSMQWKDGDSYDGTWEEDEIVAPGGEFTFADGSSFSGLWREQHESRGTLKRIDGTTIKGKFYLGKVFGDAEVSYPDGTVYTGPLKDWKQEGEGAMRFPDERCYAGHFHRGVIDGFGIMQWPDGVEYEGDWKDGKRHGRGVERVLAKDEQHEPVTVAALAQRRRRRSRASAHHGGIFEGIWVNDERHGCGVFLWPNGKESLREYSHGELVVSELVGNETDLKNLSSALERVESKLAAFTGNEMAEMAKSVKALRGSDPTKEIAKLRKEMDEFMGHMAEQMASIQQLLSQPSSSKQRK